MIVCIFSFTHLLRTNIHLLAHQQHYASLPSTNDSARFHIDISHRRSISDENGQISTLGELLLPPQCHNIVHRPVSTYPSQQNLVLLRGAAEFVCKTRASRVSLLASLLLQLPHRHPLSSKLVYKAVSLTAPRRGTSPILSLRT